MNEKAYKTMAGVGAGNIAIGIIVLTVGLAAGILILVVCVAAGMRFFKTYDLLRHPDV